MITRPWCFDGGPGAGVHLRVSRSALGKGREIIAKMVRAGPSPLGVRKLFKMKLPCPFPPRIISGFQALQQGKRLKD